MLAGTAEDPAISLGTVFRHSPLSLFGPQSPDARPLPVEAYVGWGCDEDGGVGADQHAYDHGEGEVVERPSALITTTNSSVSEVMSVLESVEFIALLTTS